LFKFASIEEYREMQARQLIKNPYNSKVKNFYLIVKKFLILKFYKKKYLIFHASIDFGFENFRLCDYNFDG